MDFKDDNFLNIKDFDQFKACLSQIACQRLFPDEPPPFELIQKLFKLSSLDTVFSQYTFNKTYSQNLSNFKKCKQLIQNGCNGISFIRKEEKITPYTIQFIKNGKTQYDLDIDGKYLYDEGSNLYLKERIQGDDRDFIFGVLDSSNSDQSLF